MECENFISNVWNGCGGLDEAWLEEHANEIEESKREYDEARRMAAEFVADDEGDDGEEYNYVHRTPMMKATKKLINDTMKEVLTYEFLEWDLSTSEMLVTIFTYDHVQAVLEEFEPMPGFPSMLLETVEHWRLRISEITRYGYKHYPRERADHDDFRLRAYGVQAVLVEYMCVCLLKKASFFADEAKVARASKSVCDTIREEQEQYERNGVQGTCTRSFALQRLRWLTEECALPGWTTVTGEKQTEKHHEQTEPETPRPRRHSLSLKLKEDTPENRAGLIRDIEGVLGTGWNQKEEKTLEAYLFGGDDTGRMMPVKLTELCVLLQGAAAVTGREGKDLQREAPAWFTQSIKGEERGINLKSLRTKYTNAYSDARKREITALFEEKLIKS